MTARIAMILTLLLWKEAGSVNAGLAYETVFWIWFAISLWSGFFASAGDFEVRTMVADRVILILDLSAVLMLVWYGEFVMAACMALALIFIAIAKERI